MVDTIWADVSEFQVAVDDTYPHKFFAFRSNDGAYRDRKFARNLAWAKKAADSGRLVGFIVYAVYEPDGGNWATTLMSQVGTPHPRMAVMIDVESWGGRIHGDHSRDINAGRARLAKWLGNPARVIGYGNGGDLRNLWPNRGDAKVVLAAYGSNPSIAGKIAHQYTSSGSCKPFGNRVDLNSADGLSPSQLAAKLGLLGAAPAGGDPVPFPTPTPTPTPDATNTESEEDDDMAKNSGFIYTRAADKARVVLISNTTSGWFMEYISAASIVPDGNNDIAATFGTGPFAEVSEKWALAHKGTLARANSSVVSGAIDVTAADAAATSA